MLDIPLTKTKRLAELNYDRTLAAMIATATQSEPEDHVFAVLHFIALDLTGRFSLLKGGVTDGN